MCEGTQSMREQTLKKSLGPGKGPWIVTLDQLYLCLPEAVSFILNKSLFIILFSKEHMESTNWFHSGSIYSLFSDFCTIQLVKFHVKMFQIQGYLKLI